MLQLSIEVPAAAGYAIGFAVATGIIATAIRTAWPVLNDKAARRVARMRRAKAARKSA
ncbi:hypothetical protein [Curtobacterium flaccumfaciens]|jgi:hypothetical protein|uniref:hypothetical protein n=1 Tax=Curtobacterium flaccumfaciens TaxID=2035 RepID=UPI001BDF4CF0|nr:hypothetical protein [Curtobacterium flaccumfaciens]MBT1631665.1 hypothetical protein [Curtobacterium flaccumfaciens pv. oortii]MCX2844178.1 hypothetical protein [Curtobacterium flaccumfaciens pv. oortii]